MKTHKISYTPFFMYAAAGLTRTPGTLKISNAANKTAVIDIDGDIGEGYWWDDDANKNTKEAIKQQLKDIAEIKADTIIVNICSLGGDYVHACAIHDLLAAHKAEVVTDMIGMCASSATVIFMAGSKRRMSANALALIHECRNGVYGPKAVQLENIKMQDKVNERIAEIYSKASNGKLSVKEALKQMAVAGGEGEWQTANEFLEMGIVTEVYEPKKMAARAAVFNAKDYRLPEVPKNKLKIINNPKAKKMANENGAQKKSPKNKKKAGLMAKLTDAINTLKNEIKGSGDKNAIQAQISGIEARVTKVEAKNTKLKAQVKAQAEELEAAKAQEKKLQAKLAKAKGKEIAPKAEAAAEDPKKGAKKTMSAHQAAEAANQAAMSDLKTKGEAKK